MNTNFAHKTLDKILKILRILIIISFVWMLASFAWCIIKNYKSLIQQINNINDIKNTMSVLDKKINSQLNDFYKNILDKDIEKINNNLEINKDKFNNFDLLISEYTKENQ